MFFSITIKNSNWEILTKNLATFKRYGFNDEKLKYFWGALKNPILKGGGKLTKNQYRGGNCLKTVGLDSLQI